MRDDAVLFRYIFDKGFNIEPKTNKAIFDHQYDKSLRPILSSIRLFKVTQPTSAILAILRGLREKEIKLSKAVELLTVIEKFHFAFTAITASPGNKLSRIYPSYAKDFYLISRQEINNITHEDNNKYLIDSLKYRFPEKDLFVSGFKQVYYEKNGDNRLVRYILENIHKKKSLSLHPSGLDFMDIEHLASQSNDTVGYFIINSLGNLILIDKKTNAEDLKDLSFQKKNEILRSLPYGVPQDVLDSENWGAKEITLRTEHLADFSYTDIWNF